MASGSLAGLRVAFVALEGFPNRKGSGVRITQTVTALADRGADVVLLTLLGDSTPINLPSRVSHRPLRVLEDNYLARALTFRDRVAQALYAERPDVVHVRGPFEGQAGLDYARRRGVPLLFEVNGLPSVELRHHHPQTARAPEFLRRLRAVEEHLIRSADRVLTQSRATARFIRLRAKAQVDPVVIPNGADLDIFRPSPRPATHGVVRIMYAGSLAPWQGLPDLLAALRRARRQADLHLTVIGPARRAWARALRRQAHALKVQDILTIEDASDQAAVAQTVRHSDICAAPLARDARNRVQGCSPIKLFEYMAAGRAVLASDLPCVREVVRAGETGWLHRASNPRRLEEALLELAGDPDLRSRLGARARKWVANEATWAHRHGQLGALYEGLTGHEARASA